MKREILKEAYEEILEDNKLIRLSIVSTIWHSITSIAYIFFSFYILLTMLPGIPKDVMYFLTYIQDYLLDLLAHRSFAIFSLIILILGVARYIFVPPIGYGAIINYLDNKSKGKRLSIGRSFSFGLKNFFTMFEYSSLVDILSIILYIMAIFRLSALGLITNNPFILPVLIIRGLVILFISVFFQYGKFSIALKKKKFSSAVKESLIMTVDNFSLTFKYVIINYILYLRFIINIILIVGIPFLIIYLFFTFGGENFTALKHLLLTVIFILFIFIAYINSIIEAFFLTYWYKIYNHINDMDKEEEEEYQVRKEQKKINEELNDDVKLIMKILKDYNGGVLDGLEEDQIKYSRLLFEKLKELGPVKEGQYSYSQYLIYMLKILDNDEMTDIYLTNPKTIFENLTFLLTRARKIYNDTKLDQNHPFYNKKLEQRSHITLSKEKVVLEREKELLEKEKELLRKEKEIIEQEKKLDN